MEPKISLKIAVLAYTAQVDGDCCAYGYMRRAGFHEQTCMANQVIADLEKRFIQNRVRAGEALRQALTIERKK